jgi:hypothetical protein
MRLLLLFGMFYFASTYTEIITTCKAQILFNMDF